MGAHSRVFSLVVVAVFFRPLVDRDPFRALLENTGRSLEPLSDR